MSDKYVILNRAPTLHRMNVQSFKPILTDGNAIKIHPLICKAFTADFDGDQMAVHVPLSFESIKESKDLLLSGKHILSPRDGKPIITLTQDMILGCFYMTLIEFDTKGAKLILSSFEEATIAFNNERITIRSVIGFRIKKNNITRSTCYGRILFNSLLPDDFGYINEVIDSKIINDIILQLTLKYPNETVIEFLEKLKYIVFKYATVSGITIGLDDLIKVDEITNILNDYKLFEYDILKENNDILTYDITESINDERNITLEKIESNLISGLINSEGFNSLNIIINSGARGTLNNFMQILAMKGFIINGFKIKARNKTKRMLPLIKNNFKIGLTTEEYLNTTSSARLLLHTEAKLTAESGYLYRILVLALRELIVTEYDCGATKGLSKIIHNNPEDKEINYYSIYGRYSSNDVYNPRNNQLVISKNVIIDNNVIDNLLLSNIESIEIRTPLSCKSSAGICQKCYGNNVVDNRIISLGESVGIIAAQSISEPTTQMILKSFHTGGVIKKTDISSGFKSIQGILLAQPSYLKDIIFDNNSDVFNADIEKSGPAMKKQLFDELVKIYRENKISINDKHLEIACNLLKFNGNFNIYHNFIDKNSVLNLLLAHIFDVYSNKSLKDTNEVIKITNELIKDKCIIQFPQSSNYHKYQFVNQGEVAKIYSKFIAEKKPKIGYIEIKPIYFVPEIKGIDKTILESDEILARISFQNVTGNIKKGIKNKVIDEFNSFSAQTMIGKKMEIGKEYVEIKRGQ